MMRFYRLVTFDVTGTLLNFKKELGHQYAEVAEQFGITASPELLARNFKIQWDNMNDMHPNFGLNTNIRWEDWWRKIVLNTFRGTTGLKSAKESEVLMVGNKLLEMFSTSECWVLNDGVLDILSSLSNHGIQIGVISNFDPRLENILKEVGIYHYFDFIISSYKVGCAKPDSKIFQIAEKNAGTLLKNELIHIGNDAYLDYKGAIESGWNAGLLYKGIDKDAVCQFPFLNPKHVFSDFTTLHQNIFLDNKVVVS